MGNRQWKSQPIARPLAISIYLLPIAYSLLPLAIMFMRVESDQYFHRYQRLIFAIPEYLKIE
jgi:hypothetical protein